ncbi:hypothetical protein cypCar_00026870 [Cyprinus carpio]|nr:hypothetical protein cypCar_00026870 [Cyprinus carpio]
MQHLRYLDSFMDEIDREVMSLTDRAFKSLCIGDEAVYNDSEFSLSPVSCHKPVVEDISKKTQESSLSAAKKLNSYPLNGGKDPLSRSNKSSKDLSLFTLFAAKKNGESTKMTNGDSWDKSALLSIQRELSEFSSDYHSLTVEHLSQVIPSRHGTGTSEILQTVLSPTALDVPPFPERELHPSPEIKREGYKSIASSLLFNLKDNRKRVKTMYSPPKFKGLDGTNQSKESPQPEASKDLLEIPEISGAKTILPARHKAIISPMSPLLETGDTQTGSPANGGMPDDYLALSLLQSGKSKSNKNPATNKATYPSLQLYRKASPEEIRANAHTVIDTSSQVFTEKSNKDHDTKHNYPSKLFKGVEYDPLESMLNAKKPTLGLNIERTLENKSGKSPSGVQSEELLRKAEVCNMTEKVDEKLKEIFQKPSIDSCSLSNHESESDVSDRVVSPPSDVDKRELVHSLIESARNLTQMSHGHTSSKDQQENCMNGSEKEEQDLDLLKDHSRVKMPAISVQSPQPKQPAMQYLSIPATHLVTVKDGKLSAGSASVSEEEELCSAVSTLSEGMDSYETSGGDTMEENISSTAPTEDAEGSKATSERSASACSGNDSQGQNKPPVVPPKTEKALRRAMKLTTRRIQKAEAKSKSERKGRSGDKSVSHKAERRHHSTDKVHERSEHRSLSSDSISSKKSEHFDDTSEPETLRSEKHARCHNGHKSQSIEENDPSKKKTHATKGKDRQTSQTGDPKSHRIEKQLEGKSNHGDHLENGNISNDRQGRSNEKLLPKKLEHRTQSLDRFLRDKHKNMLSSTGKTGGNSEFSTEGSQYSTPKALPLRHNSIEHIYPPANNLVTQSFPITQRKLLQDPDSGQYFLVDMPVQVKTKTFFDPETKSYVQLPVQSPEAVVRQAPPLEVMNTPPLVLYHGFVPVPVPSQKSVVRTAGSMIPPDDLEDFQPSRKQMQEDFYKTHKEEVSPYAEPVYTSQEHTPEEEIDSVR